MCRSRTLRSRLPPETRCRDNRDAYFWLTQELEPTLKELGIKTPDELGFYDGDEEYNEPTWQDWR